MDNLTRKIIAEHLVEGRMEPGAELALRVDQCLIQDATGTLVWQQFESFGIDRIRVPQAVTYVDHNMLQTDFRNPDDHLFLQTTCARYGAIFSRPGNGISHFAALERFDVPGQLMIGADSHTSTAGALAMLAIGTGGLEVAAALAGEPFYVKMPRVVRVLLTGELPPWVAAKDVILDLLRRIGVKGGIGKVMEYVGPAAANLTVWERATICNMTEETGATSGIFPSDAMARRFLRSQRREQDFKPLAPDPDADYDEEIEIDLSLLEPLVAKPHSPDNVVAVREVEGTPVRQVAVGSSVNSSYRDLKVVAQILKGKHVSPNLHMVLSPGSRQIILNLTRDGVTADLIAAGVRELEVACGPCIGMGAAPPSGGNSLRTFNRNFRGRSGTDDDRVWLCSPEVAAAAALRGAITDPRSLGRPPETSEPAEYLVYTAGFLQPADDPASVQIHRGPNIVPPPPGKPLPASTRGEVLIKVGDNFSTDDILPAGNEILPLRSNIPAISEYAFVYFDRDFVKRAKEKRGGFIVAGANYGQGSSREHAAIAKMYLGIQAVLALSYARIHESNLVNFAIAPLRFASGADYGRIEQGDTLEIPDLSGQVARGEPIRARNRNRGEDYLLELVLSRRQVQILLAGGLGLALKAKWATPAAQ